MQEWDYTVLMVADPLTRLLELAQSVRLEMLQIDSYTVPRPGFSTNLILL